MILGASGAGKSSTVDDLEVAKDMVLEWHESGDYCAVDIVVKVYEHLAAAAHCAG